MSPSRPFILRPIATTLLMVAVLLVGFVAYRQLPVSALPQVDYPTIQIQTFYPGASPDVVVSSVTAPLERQFGQIPGLNQMTSTSSFGSSLITLQFSNEQCRAEGARASYGHDDEHAHQPHAHAQSEQPALAQAIVDGERAKGRQCCSHADSRGG